MATSGATTPRAIVCSAPSRVVALTAAPNVMGVPCQRSTIPTSTASGRTFCNEPMSPESQATAADRLLARLQDREHARLRVYIGAAPGVGKTYLMLRDAHQLRERGLDVVVALVETYGRAETEAQIGTLEDVLALLDAGIHVWTAVNIQHIETLNDAVARMTGVRVRETVPDTFLDRADEVINVDVTTGELRNRLRQGKVHRPDKIEQALSNFFRKGNLTALRELALRLVADELGATVVRVKAEKAAEGLIAFAQREGITHVVFGQSQRSRWQMLLHGSAIDRFLTDVPDATVQVVPVRA